MGSLHFCKATHFLINYLILCRILNYLYQKGVKALSTKASSPVI